MQRVKRRFSEVRNLASVLGVFRDFGIYSCRVKNPSTVEKSRQSFPRIMTISTIYNGDSAFLICGHLLLEQLPCLSSSGAIWRMTDG